MKFPIHTLLFTVAAVVVAVVFTGCGGERKYRVGVSQCSDDDWRSKMNEEIMREAMLHDNIEVEIRSADDDNARQIADLDYFTSNNFDIIIVAPNEADALTPHIREIFESGKPVILFDRTIHGDSYTAFQGADNEAIGRMAAAILPAYAASPRVLEITGRRGSTPAELRRRGFHAAADSLGFAIVGEATGNWNYAEGAHAADSLLRAHPEANVVYAHNDRMAIAARKAARKLGRDDIRVIGIDAAPSIGIQAVADGTIDATFLYPTDGDRLLRTAIDILEGREYTRNAVLPSPSAVDSTNAEILLTQDRALRAETEKISVLQSRMDSFSRKYATQTTLLYGAVVIVLLLAAMTFLLMHWYWSSKRHRAETERQNTELARQRDELDSLYRQLREATASRLSWFTNVSHDLRTPLTLIADPVHQLAASPSLSPREHTLMELADKNVKRLLRLVNQILDIRKYDNSQLHLHPANIEVSKALAEWTAPFAELARKHHIRFRVEYLPADETIAALDIEKTERILFNLLSNAFKFTPENGTVTVTVDRRGDTLEIRVADTGIGIPPEDINNIFNRFFKTDRINPNGSGIGLALTKVFIELHGGTIAVESNVGQGTTFTVALPIHTVDAPAAEAPALQRPDLSELRPVEVELPEIAEDTPTVLVVDDNPDICTLVRSVLADSYAVVVAQSGAQAIRLATRYLPDLVICDVMMPGMDGYEVCRALKTEPLTSHIPVLLLTACSRDEQRLEGYDCGADAYMSKPFDSAMLAARCRSLIDNRRLVYRRFEADGVPEAPAAEAPATVDDEFLKRFMDVVEENMADASLSVEAVADRLGLSRVQMYRKVKALTNYSASEMIRNVRLRRAALMLKTTTATVSEVAYAVGFSSPSYFSRCYKDFYGESPVDTQGRTSKKH